MDAPSEFLFLVAIEIDPGRIRERARESRPNAAILDQGDSEQMLAHLAADLAKLFPDFRKCRLAAAGALFDQCQVLRPGTPVFSALASAARAHGDTPGQTAVGATDEGMADPALRPDGEIPPSLLTLLPMLALGNRELIESLSSEMEHRFLAEGQVSPHTAGWLESAFGVGIGHARFMTLTDLNAMFRMQLEHHGYLPLWSLIDAAVSGNPDVEAQTTATGAHFQLRGERVQVIFQTFNHWARHAGSEAGAEDDALPRAYAEWTRELRRYVSTLAAHHVPVEFRLPDDCKGEITEHFLYEDVPSPAAGSPLASITEHGWPDLGTVAITALTPDTMRHYYPLTPHGLNLIHETLGAMELVGEGMAFPGTIKFNAGQRSLRPVVF